MPDKKKRCVIITAMHDADIINPITTSIDIGVEDYVVCADGGFLYAQKEGIIPDIIIGDLDSVSKEDVEASKIDYETYNTEKDDTDTMLCAKHAISKGFEKVVIVGGIGGSLDHTMANIQTLSFLIDLEREAAILSPKEKLIMLNGDTVKIASGIERKPKPPAELEFSGTPGKKFSLFSYEERTTDVCIENAKYLLDKAVLTQSYPIGARNEFINEQPVKIKIGFGRLLIIIGR